MPYPHRQRSPVGFEINICNIWFPGTRQQSQRQLHCSVARSLAVHTSLVRRGGGFSHPFLLLSSVQSMGQSQAVSQGLPAMLPSLSPPELPTMLVSFLLAVGEDSCKQHSFPVMNHYSDRTLQTLHILFFLQCICFLTVCDMYLYIVYLCFLATFSCNLSASA